jgi:hypothetical protein
MFAAPTELVEITKVALGGTPSGVRALAAGASAKMSDFDQGCRPPRHHKFY